MSKIVILKNIILIATIATGLLSFIKPDLVFGFTGLKAEGARGISEIRAIFGGLLIGLGIAPFILGGTTSYKVVGFGYLAIALTRAFSIIFDKSYAQSNIISLVIEIVFGVILVI